MDACDLHLKIEYLGFCGVVLTPEQKASLQTSLVILKNEQKFAYVQLWGIIKGVKSDYYIAQGIGKDFLLDRRTVYSKDCLIWGLLPEPTKEEIKKCSYFKGRFTGDPSFEFEHTEINQVPGEGDEVKLIEEVMTMKEENRLAAVIARIDHDVQIVPRAAYMRLPTGNVIKNRAYEGLTVQEASKLSSFFHFRTPLKLPAFPLVDRAKLDKAIDFLETVEGDIPKSDII